MGGDQKYGHLLKEHKIDSCFVCFLQGRGSPVTREMVFLLVNFAAPEEADGGDARGLVDIASNGHVSMQEYEDAYLKVLALSEDYRLSAKCLIAALRTLDAVASASSEPSSTPEPVSALAESAAIPEPEKEEKKEKKDDKDDKDDEKKKKSSHKSSHKKEKKEGDDKEEKKDKKKSSSSHKSKRDDKKHGKDKKEKKKRSAGSGEIVRYIEVVKTQADVLNNCACLCLEDLVRKFCAVIGTHIVGAAFDENTLDREVECIKIIDHLMDINALLEDYQCREEIMCQFFSRVTYFINAAVFNALLENKEYCTPDRTMNARLAITEIETRFRRRPPFKKAVDQFAHVKEAANMFALDSSLLVDVEFLVAIVPDLNLPQISRLADNFTPALDSAFVQKLKTDAEGDDRELLLESFKWLED